MLKISDAVTLFIVPLNPKTATDPEPEAGTQGVEFHYII